MLARPQSSPSRHAPVGDACVFQWRVPYLLAMEMDLRALSDEELAPAVARAVNELQWRLDSESERARRTKLELLARGIKTGRVTPR